MIGKVLKISEGGLLTPQGKTPAQVRVIVDMNFVYIPQIPILAIARVPDPQGEKIAELLTDQVNKL